MSHGRMGYCPHGWRDRYDCDVCREPRLAELVELVRNWLKESPMSERISVRRCRELRGILDEMDPRQD